MTWTSKAVALGDALGSELWMGLGVALALSFYSTLGESVIVRPCQLQA